MATLMKTEYNQAGELREPVLHLTGELIRRRHHQDRVTAHDRQVEPGDVVRQGEFRLLLDCVLHQQLLSFHQLVDLQAGLAGMSADAIQR